MEPSAFSTTRAFREWRRFPEYRPCFCGEPKHSGFRGISVDTAQRQADKHGLTLEFELALLTVHSILHLIGYEDETEAGAALMRIRECEILGEALGDRG